MFHYDDVDASEWDTDDTQQVRLDESGVLLIRYIRPTVLTLDGMARQWRHYLRVAGDGKHPYLVDMRNVTDATRDARRFTAKKTGEHCTACGLVVVSAIERTVANFFIQIGRPVAPTKLFATAEEAHAWLLAQPSQSG